VPSSSGQESVEVHHRVQASLVDLLEELLRRGGDRALAEETLTRLVDFTAAHFQTEESLMRQHGFPQAQEHAGEHGRLLAAVRRIRAAHAAGDPRGADLVGELRSWLMDHVHAMDASFLEWLAGREAHAR